MAYRRRSSTFEDVLHAIMRSQVAAVCFAMVGAVLASPLPRALLNTVSVGDLTDNPYAGMVGGAYLSAGHYLLPIVGLVGLLLMLLGSGSLLFNGRKPGFRTMLKSHAANNAAATAIVAVSILICLIDPPRLMRNNREIVEAGAAATGRRLASIDEPPVGSAFPEHGTVRWGDAGQPIGGNLERFEIWDVTQSPERKVVAIRNGLIPDYPGVRTIPYATVYIHPGQRVSLMLPAGIPYHVTAMAGPDWEGGDALFSTTGTTVDFGRTMLMSGQPQIIAMGAPDQTANVVPNNRF